MKDRYIIAVYYNGEFSSYVDMFNYKKEEWSSGTKPKIFKSIDMVNKCHKQIKKYATAVELKTMVLKEL